MSDPRKKSLLRRLDYFFVLRPMLFFPGWTTMLAGFFIAENSELFTLYYAPSHLDYFLLFRLMFGFALLMGSAFILNQLADAESDRRNDKLYLIADGHVPRPDARKQAYILAIIAILIGLTCSLWVAIFFIIFYFITGYLYNYYPLKLKDRPWGSFIANVSMGWLAFAIGWIAQSEFSDKIVLDSIPYVLFNTMLYLYTLLPDIRGDRLTGKKTLAVVYGPDKVIFISGIFFAFGLGSVLLIQDLTALGFYFLSMPFIVKTMYFLEIPDAIRSTKFAILFFSLIICFKWPPYFILMLSGFMLTKFYYTHRFNLNYPNFSGS